MQIRTLFGRTPKNFLEQESRSFPAFLARMFFDMAFSVSPLQAVPLSVWAGSALALKNVSIEMSSITSPMYLLLRYQSQKLNDYLFVSLISN